MSELEVVFALLFGAFTWVIGYVIGYVDKGKE